MSHASINFSKLIAPSKICLASRDVPHEASIINLPRIKYRVELKTLSKAIARLYGHLVDARFGYLRGSPG